MIQEKRKGESHTHNCHRYDTPTKTEVTLVPPDGTLVLLYVYGLLDTEDSKSLRLPEWAPVCRVRTHGCVYVCVRTLPLCFNPTSLSQSYITPRLFPVLLSSGKDGEGRLKGPTRHTKPQYR